MSGWQTREIGEVRHEQVCRQRRRQRHPQEARGTLCSRPKTRVSSRCGRRFHLVPRTRGPPRPQPSGGLGPKATFRNIVDPEAFLEAGRCVRSTVAWFHTEGARLQPAPSLRARRQESSERHPQSIMVQSPHRAVRLPSPYLTQSNSSTGQHHKPVPTSTAQFRTGGPDRRGWRQPSSRIDFRTHRCARFRHSTPAARWDPMSRFFGGRCCPDTTTGEIMGKA